MDAINVVCKNGDVVQMRTESLSEENILSADTPYFVRLDSLPPSQIKIMYMFHDEMKNTATIGNTSIEIGLISGKIYSYTKNDDGLYVLPAKFIDKLKEILKEEISQDKSGLVEISNRQKSNLKYGLKLLEIVIDFISSSGNN